MTVTLKPLLAAAALATLAGCASHEGVLTAGKTPAPKPVENLTKTQPAKPAAKPITFRYNPKPGTYTYALLTTQTSSSGRRHDVEQDFSIVISRKADRFQTVGTITRWLVDGATPPDKGAITAGFKLESTLNPHGAVESAKLTDPAQAFPPDMKDLGTAFQLPPDPLMPGDTWTMQKTDGGPLFTITFKFNGLTTVDNRKVAEFEEQASDAAGNKTDQPTLIRVDPATGLLVEKDSEFSRTVGEGADRQVISSKSRLILK